MTRWIDLHSFSEQDIKEMLEECRADFRVGSIGEKEFRRKMTNLGISPQELDHEVRDNEP